MIAAIDAHKSTDGCRLLLRHEEIATTSRYLYLDEDDRTARLGRVAL